MIHSFDNNNNYRYTFIFKDNWLNNVNTKNQIFNNDIYKKYNAKIVAEGELLICTNVTKMDSFCKRIVAETYVEYLDILQKRDFSKEQWVYNILDGKAEQKNVLYKDNNLIIVPNFTWNGTDIKKLYLLAFPFDRALHTIRSLTGEHVGLLKQIRQQAFSIIEKKYNITSDLIKAFIHYTPSSFHLHVHFTLVSNLDVNSSVEYSHDLNNIIFNLEIKSDYYQTIIMNKRI